MDEGDDYVPQMSQMADYTQMAQMGGPAPPQQRYPPPGMPMNPYEQQQHHQMMMMQQQQHMQHMASQQQQQAAAAQPAPAKKPRGKSKKAQAAEAAAAAAAAANQMDPMASMAAMSNNPMMRGNAYPNQIAMYGGAHYQGVNGPAQQGYRPGPIAGAPQQYPQNYQQMYHPQQPPQQQQRAPPQQQQQQSQPGYPYGYGQTPAGYPPQPPPQQTQYPQQAPPQHMRHQYAPQGQQPPPGYWEGYPGYGNSVPVPQQTVPVPPQLPVTSQPMTMPSQQQNQWTPQPPQPTPADLMNVIAQLEKSAAEIKGRMQQIYNLPRNTAADAEIQQLQHKLGAIQNDIYRYGQQLQQLQQYPPMPGQHHPGSVPPPTSQTASMPPSQHITPNPTPVHVNQSGSQVQLNITADKSRTLISVYHEGYGGSGASSTESKESIVPPEPTPSMQQQPPEPPVPQQQQQTPQQVPQVKREPEKVAAYQQQTPQQQSYNGMENGSSANPYAQQQMYGQQYPHPNMAGYPQQHQAMHQQLQAPAGYGRAPSAPQDMQQIQPPSVESSQHQQFPGYPPEFAVSSTFTSQSSDSNQNSGGAQQLPITEAEPIKHGIAEPAESEVSSSTVEPVQQHQQSIADVVESMPHAAELIQVPSLNPAEPIDEQKPEEQDIEPEPIKIEQKPVDDWKEDVGEEQEQQISDESEPHNNGHIVDSTTSAVILDNNQLEVAQEEEVESEGDTTMVKAEEEEEEEEAPVMLEDINNLAGEEVFGEEGADEDDILKKQEYPEEKDDEEYVQPEGSVEPEEEEEEREQKEEQEEDDDQSSITTKDDFKDMSEAPSETNDGFTEPSTPATPMMVTPSSKKKTYRRPAVVVSKSKKKKSVDDSDDDDFYPARGKGRKKGGGGGKKKNDLVIVGEESQDGQKSGESDDDEFLIKVEAPAVDPNALVVEKILNLRVHKEEVEEGAEPKEEVEQFLIKWKGRSYVHCEWKSAAELLEIDKRVDGKIKRFRAKKSVSYIDDDEDFNSDYVIVDRVVDLITEEDGQEFVLIKWKSLGYEEVTWEPVENVPAEKVHVWRRRQVIDPAKVKEKARPEPEEWKKLSQSKVWKNGNSLREYQFEGVDWLLYCYYNAQNCILADEMGLGKTVQTITFLSQVYDFGVRGPFLIVVPLSTIHNWVREFETWTDMNAVVYHGSAYAREVLQQYEVFYDKRHSGSKNWRKNFVKLDALITTFETVVSDVEFLKKIPWRVCVIDEAHRLKNRNCKLLVNGLLAFRMEHRVLLTGTPLQNNIEELFSLLNFLHPLQFNNSATFLEQFGSCQTDDQVQKLQEILRPMMLRRLKEDVEKSLGPKEETIIEVQLSDMQKKFYRAILERNFSHLCKGTSAPSLMNVMMELRKCCNHPFLINGAEETIMNDFRTAHPDWDDETLAHKALIQSSGKVVLIEKLLPKLRKDGHKVLIFSQMVKVLDLLEEFLISMAYPFERIDGNVRGDLRQASIDRFSKENSDRFVFLLCTRAGGLGINLTAADTVIIFDSDWNPQNDLQAQARCHRIGQKKLVKVYRLITSNTYEREMFDKASLKLGLDKAVLQSTTALKAEGTALSKKDVEELLKKGAYGSIMDEENESAKFNEEDIETILQRRTQTITLEAGQKGSLFAKASFNSTHNKGDDIDLDDPEFWNKWAEKAQVDVEKATATPDGRELILEEPRKRTKRFEDNKIDEEDSDGSEESGKRKRNAQGASARKRRRDDEDTDYSASYRPDELATSKTEYFKVEKVLAQYGWGRWAEIKKYGELEIAEQDIEHMSRTLLLHCIREFRGDDRIRQFVFNLIKPQGGNGSKEVKSGSSVYHQGWAALPEFNPPSFALDSAFQRHVHRHANKLMVKIDMLKHLETHIIGDERAIVEDPTVKWTDIKLMEMPSVSETFIEGWDADCDKCFLIGCWRHGLDNYEVMRADETLCFTKKTFPNWPPPSDFWLRFRRLLMVSQRSVHDPVYEKLKWTKREEQEFMRVLRSFGIKESKPGPGVDWAPFRAFSPILEKKSDEECHEQLMCVLAMCNRAQGSNDLKPIDLKRAMSVDPMSSRRAVKVLNRLHLMRKVHTLADHLEVADLSMCETTGMPSGWSTQHDKELIEICDQCGLDQLAANVLNKPAFTKIVRPSETTLVRRIIEIVSTIESGKWCGVGDVESVNDSDSEEKKEIANMAAAQQQFLRLQQQHQAAAAATAAASRKGGRKRPNNDQDAARSRAVQQALLGGAGHAEYASLMALMMLSPQMLGTQNMSAAQQQQVSQLLALVLASAVQQSAAPAASSSSSKNSSSNQQQSAAGMLAQAAAASNDAAAAAQQQAVLEALLAMTMNPAALAALTGTAQPSTSATSSSTPTPAKKMSKPAPKETASSTASAAAAAAAASQASQAAQAVALAQQKQQEQLIVQLLNTAGIGIPELNKLNTMSKDVKIPMVHKTTKEALPESKRPQIRDLTVFVMSNQEWKLDLPAFTEMTKAVPSSARPSAPATPAPTATPKPATPKVEPKPSTSTAASATCNIKVGGSLALDDMVSVFNRNTGELLAASKWPKAKDLATWLEANPEYNVHSNSALIATLSLGSVHNDRIGGDSFSTPVATSIPSTAHTPAPPLTPSTPSAASTAAANAAATAAANAQLVALAAASAAAQQQAQTNATPTSTSKSRNAAAAAQAQAQAQANQEAKQQMELLQMQMFLQQYQQTAALQAMMYGGYGMPTTSAASSTANVASMAAMAAAQAAVVNSTPTTTKAATSSTPSTSSAAAASAAASSSANSAEDINPLLLSALMQNPAILQSMMLSDPSVLVALSAQAHQQQQPAAKKSKHP
ncbi:unnamed protein product [Caenorhabditis sp. 36 PRJEB53466]|nr:unnamed protein product [Caenorhabditis sp. 36 PRJEB53466]